MKPPGRHLLVVLALLVLTAGCSRSFETDGSPEAELVRKWLSQGWPASRGNEDLIAPQAPLVMSDYQLPLTRHSLRRMGPDGRSGCARYMLRRQGETVVASWTCRESTDPAFRTVHFRIEKGRIASANYIEAYQAVRAD